jgi:hypothetical protein
MLRALKTNSIHQVKKNVVGIEAALNGYWKIN